MSQSSVVVAVSPLAKTRVTLPSSMVALLTALPAFCAASSAARNVGLRLRTDFFGGSLMACLPTDSCYGGLDHPALALHVFEMKLGHRPFALGAFTLPLSLSISACHFARAGGGLRRHPHQSGRPLAEHAKDDRAVGVHDDLDRAGLQAAVTGNPQRAESVVTPEAVRAATSHRVTSV